MASYLDQIPKQLGARRKAFRAARDNPALLPSCWAIVRSIANNMYEYTRNSVIGGCTFPDRPVYLSNDDAAFLNFGATPTLLMADAAWQEAEAAGQPPPEAERPRPGEEGAARVRRQLAAVARTYGLDHPVTRVYNLEPWLQDMYRDRLDVDFAEDLQRQIDALNDFMDSVPKSIAATGLDARMAKGVMDAFNLFKTITGSSHQLDREKMSFVDRRSYVNTIQKIELIMEKADQLLGSAVAGRSVVRENYSLWKDANYEMMALTRQLRALWAGTSLDDRIQELADLLGAIQKAMNRCTEESRTPMPQLPVLRADDVNADPLTRADIVGAFHAVTLYDMIAGGNATLKVREIRKFGPLAVVITPGNGQPRYCSEVRRLGQDDEDPRKRKDTQSNERENDVDRRIRYPLNCLVVPVNAPRDAFRADLADGWLEYNQAAFPVQYKEFLELAKSAAPGVFLPPEDKTAKDLPATYARQMLGRLVAWFVEWAHSGKAPSEDEAPGFEPFKDMVLSRLRPDDFLLPARYRPLVDLYSEAGARRRGEMWKRYLGPRYALDRQLVAVSVLMKDWNALRNYLKFLPISQTKGDSNLQNGFAKVDDKADQFSESKAIGFFQKFLTEQPDLKSAMVSVESQVSIEIETLRSQSESLGRVFQYDQASETMLRQQASRIQEKRLAANAHIDHYLTGLLYAVDGNLEAAENALSMCLTPKDRQVLATPAELALKEVGDEVGEEWFAATLQPREGKFEKRLVPGEDGQGTATYEMVYYNLGIVYLKMKRYIEARMAFKALRDDADPETSYLYLQWAEAHAAAAAEEMAGAAAE